MRRRINGEAVNQLLNREVLHFPKVGRVVFLDNRNEPAGARGVCPPEAWVIFDHVGTLRQGEMRKGVVRIQRKNRERLVSAAK